MSLVSIICGAYNVEETLESSLDSIVNQTYKNWELIICDDGSKDNTLEILEAYKSRLGNKMKIIRNEKNLGLNASLNKCIQLIEGEYVARHDLDDISHENRLQVQVNFLNTHPEYSLVGCGMLREDEGGIWGETILNETPAKLDLVKASPFCHATILMKTNVLKQLEGYSKNSKTIRVEDYELWFRLYAAGFKGYNIQQSLYTMLDDRNAYSRRKYKYRLNEAYVKFNGYKSLDLPKTQYINVLKPLVVGLIPFPIYNYLRKRMYK